MNEWHGGDHEGLIFDHARALKFEFTLRHGFFATVATRARSAMIYVGSHEQMARGDNNVHGTRTRVYERQIRWIKVHRGFTSWSFHGTPERCASFSLEMGLLTAIDSVTREARQARKDEEDAAAAAYRKKRLAPPRGYNDKQRDREPADLGLAINNQDDAGNNAPEGDQDDNGNNAPGGDQDDTGNDAWGGSNGQDNAGKDA